MVEYKLGVTPVAQYEVHRVDIDYFEEESLSYIVKQVKDRS